MTEVPPDDLASDQSQQLTEDAERELMRREETWNNFPLSLYPYHDSQYLEEVAPFVIKDPEDFKRITHAHLLSKGSNEGWVMDDLKTAVRISMGFDDNKKVDQFVKKEFRYANFEQFIKVTVDIAIVDENNHVFPFLDDETRPLYEDALASTKNKDDKERKKDEKIARELADPKNVEEFYRGVNRLRKAIAEAVKIHGGKDNAITEIHVMDGTGDVVNAIQYNYVAIEYESLFERKLPDDSKKICGRSTLMKGLTKGQGPNCFIETFAMEVKTEGAKGLYIGIKHNTHEYSEAEIQLEVEKCYQMRSQADHRLRKWDERDNRPPREPIVKPGEREKAERQRLMREQLEGQTAPPQTASTSSHLSTPHPVTQSIPQSAPPSHSPNTTSSSGRLDQITRGIPTATNGRPFEEIETDRVMPPPASSRYDSDGDSDSNQDYSDDENIDEKRKAAADKKKKKKEKEKERKRQEAESAAASFPPPSGYTRDELVQLQESAPQHSTPPPPHFSDDHQTEAELEQNFANIAVSTQNVYSRRGVGQVNEWDTGDPSPVQQLQQQQQTVQQPAAAPTPVMAPQTIPTEMYQQQQQHPYGQEQQPQYGQQPPVACSSPFDGQQYSNSPSPFGDTPQQTPMPPQQQYDPYAPPLQYPGGPGMAPPQSPFTDYGSTFSHSQTGPQGPHYGPSPTPPMAPSGPYNASIPPYSPYAHYSHPHQPPYNSAAPPLPYYPQYPPYGAYPPPQPYPYVLPPTQPGYAQAGQPTPGGNQSPIVNVQVVHGGPVPGSEHHQFPPTSVYSTPTPLNPAPSSHSGHPPPQGSSHYRGVASEHVHYGVHELPLDSRYSRGQPPPPPQESPYQIPSLRRRDDGFPPREEYSSHTGYIPARRIVMDDGRGDREYRNGHGPPSPPSPPSPSYPPPRATEREEMRRRRMRMEEEEEMDRRMQHQSMRMRDGAREGGEIEKGFRKNDRDRGGGRGYGQPEGQSRGFGEGCFNDDGQMMRRQDGTHVAPRGQRDAPRRNEGQARRDGGFGQREGEGGMGDGRKESRSDGRRDEVGRAGTFGRPRGTSTPLNTSHEGDNLWTSHINQFNTPRRRIRWQIISILKIMRDKNRLKMAQEREDQFELIEIDILYQVIMLGCGNEMELFQATQEVDMDGGNLFFNFLRDMEGSGLCKLFKGKYKNPKTGVLEDKMYVMDPFIKPPPHYSLMRC